MTIITEVQGPVSQLQAKEFEEPFSAARMEPLPDGFISSTLLQNMKEKDIYKIQTLWKNMEALDKMRSTTQTPKAIELFQKVGAEPKVEIYEVSDSIP